MLHVAYVSLHSLIDIIITCVGNSLENTGVPRYVIVMWLTDSWSILVV